MKSTLMPHVQVENLLRECRTVYHETGEIADGDLYEYDGDDE